MNVAGTSAGAIIATLLVAGYAPEELKKLIGGLDYRLFADYGFGGPLIGGLRNAIRRRGLARGEFFRTWIADRLGESKLGNRDATFADVTRDDLPPGLTADEQESYGYRLRVIASDVSEGKMVVLPHDIASYEDEHGRPRAPHRRRRTAVELSRSAVRTISIPTGTVDTLDFDLSKDDRDALFAGGHDVARDFFRKTPEYVNQHGQRAPVRVLGKSSSR